MDHLPPKNKQAVMSEAVGGVSGRRSFLSELSPKTRSVRPPTPASFPLEPPPIPLASSRDFKTVLLPHSNCAPVYSLSYPHGHGRIWVRRNALARSAFRVACEKSRHSAARLWSGATRAAPEWTRSGGEKSAATSLIGGSPSVLQYLLVRKSACKVMFSPNQRSAWP